MLKDAKDTNDRNEMNGRGGEDETFTVQFVPLIEDSEIYVIPNDVLQ